MSQLENNVRCLSKVTLYKFTIPHVMYIGKGRKKVDSPIEISSNRSASDSKKIKQGVVMSSTPL